MRPIKKAFVLVCLLVLACCVLELMHAFRFGHFAPLGLHADVTVRKADYGIPGISKVYEPRLSNFGITPKTVLVCRVQEDWDSASFVMEVGNSIEKWDPNSKRRSGVRTSPAPPFFSIHVRAEDQPLPRKLFRLAGEWFEL